MLNLIKKMAPLFAMLAVTACNTAPGSFIQEDNTFVKSHDSAGTFITAFCYSSTIEKCSVYLRSNCRGANITNITEGSGYRSMITVSADCQESGIK